MAGSWRARPSAPRNVCSRGSWRSSNQSCCPELKCIFHFCPKNDQLADGFQFVDNFLLLHASVLEPYRDLSLRQVGLRGYPPPFVLCDKFIGGVLALELLQLHLGVWHALLPSTAIRARLSSDVRRGVCQSNTKLFSHSLTFFSNMAV